MKSTNLNKVSGGVTNVNSTEAPDIDLTLGGSNGLYVGDGLTIVDNQQRDEQSSSTTDVDQTTVHHHKGFRLF